MKIPYAMLMQEKAELTIAMNRIGDTLTGCTVFLEDCGQDFLEFDIQGGKIIATRPFQGFVWDGREVRNETLSHGDHIDFANGRTLRYRVVGVREFGAGTSSLAAVSGGHGPSGQQGAAA